MIPITDEFPSYLRDVDKLLVSVSPPPTAVRPTPLFLSNKNVRYVFGILRLCFKRSACFEMFWVFVLK
jgi:hypothetical protein